MNSEILKAVRETKPASATQPIDLAKQFQLEMKKVYLARTEFEKTNGPFLDFLNQRKAIQSELKFQEFARTDPAMVAKGIGKPKGVERLEEQLKGLEKKIEPLMKHINEANNVFSAWALTKFTDSDMKPKREISRLYFDELKDGLDTFFETTSMGSMRAPTFEVKRIRNNAPFVIFSGWPYFYAAVYNMDSDRLTLGHVVKDRPQY